MMIWDEQYRQRDGFRRWPSEDVVRFIARRYGNVPNAIRARITIADLGCGAGNNLVLLAAEGFRAVGVDSSEAALARARANLDRWNLDAKLERHELMHLPFADGSVDALIDSMASQHLSMPDHLSAYREAHRVLGTGGALLCVHLAEGTSDYKALFSGSPWAWLAPTDKLVAILRQAGFPSVEWDSVVRTYRGRKQRAIYIVAEAMK